MGGERTIRIDPSLFTGSKGKSKNSGAGSGGHNRTIRKERKARPKPKGPSATSLRRNLLAKIKEHQQKETIEAKHKESEKPAPPHSGNTSYGGLDGNAFEDEFTRSLAYLSALAKTRETTRADKKKQKAKLKFRNSNKQQQVNQTSATITPTVQPTINTPQGQSQPALAHSSSRISYNTTTQSAPTAQKIPVTRPVVGHNKTMRQIPDRPTGLSGVSTKVPDISLEMPPELDVTPKVEVQVLPTPGPAVPIKSDPPYGVLKGGTKPTYRSYTKTQRNPSSVTTSQTLQKPVSALSNPNLNPNTKPIISATEHIRNETKTRLKQPQEKKLVIPSNSTRAPTGGTLGSSASTKPARRSKTVKRTTSTRHFKLGKDAKRRVISVFIKNNKTRRRVKLEIGQLKRVPIKDVKSYLRKHNLLKVGSSAPNDVLRQMYEQSVLSGDVHNLAKDTLIHNFMNDKE